MIHFHERFLVAVAMKQNFCRKLGKRILWGVILQKLAKQKCLATEPVGALVGGKQIVQLIPKHRSATRLQDDNWQPRINLRAESAHDLKQFVFSSLQHAQVIKRSPAAQGATGASHREASILQHFQRGLAGFWMIVVVKGIYP